MKTEKIDWKGKLSSRKFWMCLAGLVLSMLVTFDVGSVLAERVVGMITAFGAVAVYILAEASVDRAHEEGHDEDIDGSAPDAEVDEW